MSKNNNVLEEINCLSQLDDAQVLRDVHSYPGHYLRVRDANTLVKNNFDTYSVTYDVEGNPTEICYFKGTVPHITEIAFSADVSSSLNNKYFLTYSAKTGILYHVWYNVNGAGTDPAPAGSVGIEIPIAENETSTMVAYATQLVFNTVLKSSFNITRANSVLTIINEVLGEIQDTVDVDTSFLFSNTQGADELINKINITYDGDNNPIYKGVVLKGYTFNIVTGQFELTQSSAGESTASTGFNTCNVTAVTVTSTATDLVLVELENRSLITIQNLGKDAIYVGCDAGVTKDNGIKIDRKDSGEFEFGDGINVYAISEDKDCDVRIIELAK